jgi:putative ABC transport system substrate-binding protein
VRRRDFIGGVGASAVVGSRGTWAQQLPVVGFIAPGSAALTEIVTAFRQGMAKAGFVEGRNLSVEYRWAGTDFDKLPGFAQELVDRRVALIFAMGAASAVAAQSTAKALPVVFYMGEDPISLGVVQSFNRPGGNLTGVATLSSAVMAKRMELLHELVPRAQVSAVLINPKNPSAEISAKDARDAAAKLGKKAHIVYASTLAEIEQAFATVTKLRADALLIAPDGLFIFHVKQVAELAKRHSIPASHERRAFPAEGGLMSYGANQAEGVTLAASYAGRVLRGEHPANMPVLQPTKFEMVLNLREAKSLGITVPSTILAIADEIIE